MGDTDQCTWCGAEVPLRGMTLHVGGLQTLQKARSLRLPVHWGVRQWGKLKRKWKKQLQKTWRTFVVDRGRRRNSGSYHKQHE
eukprot:373008-Rhodomonas_salina.1